MGRMPYPYTPPQVWDFVAPNTVLIVADPSLRPFTHLCHHLSIHRSVTGMSCNESTNRLWERTSLSTWLKVHPGNSRGRILNRHFISPMLRCLLLRQARIWLPPSSQHCLPSLPSHQTFIPLSVSFFLPCSFILLYILLSLSQRKNN